MKRVAKFIKQYDQFGYTPALYANGESTFNSLTGGLVTLVLNIFIFQSLLKNLDTMANFGQDTVQKTQSDIDDNVLKLDDSGYMPFFEVKYRNEPINIVKNHEGFKNINRVM